MHPVARSGGDARPVLRILGLVFGLALVGGSVSGTSQLSHSQAGASQAGASQAGASQSGANRPRSEPQSAPTSPPPASPTPVTYRAPVPAPWRVVRPFLAPSSRYGAGHRGVDLAVSPGRGIVAAAAGTVTYAGTLAGRGIVVLLHDDGIRTEYEPVRPLVRRSDHVRAGQLIATIDGKHLDCLPDRCLHWGARRGTAYLDPLSLLTALGPVRLLPLTGAPTP
ncbi:M23 family metallopeptidase [Jatrophihabitans sp.]|uniref:M23 family metallopeptidase n=1 Tax=Jatrophihabitans sp. TaxID=1932789 RepID=UPI0030C7459F|nr:putative peptidase [Jatrophihabitans sp.]